MAVMKLPKSPCDKFHFTWVHIQHTVLKLDDSLLPHAHLHEWIIWIYKIRLNNKCITSPKANVIMTNGVSPGIIITSWIPLFNLSAEQSKR